jgi:L-asparagine transporter-like permease
MHPSDLQPGHGQSPAPPKDPDPRVLAPVAQSLVELIIVIMLNCCVWGVYRYWQAQVPGDPGPRAQAPAAHSSVEHSFTISFICTSCAFVLLLICPSCAFVLLLICPSCAFVLTLICTSCAFYKVRDGTTPAPQHTHPCIPVPIKRDHVTT